MSEKKPSSRKKSGTIDNKEIQNADDIPFETAIAQLEEIVRKLESGGSNLDESLKLFEEGIRTSAQCNQILDKAQMRMDILIQTPSGLKIQPMESTESADLDLDWENKT